MNEQVCGDGVVVLYCGIPESAWGPHMTLAIGICTPEGIVLAADGRVSRRELGGYVIMREDARKIIEFGRFGIAAAGFNGLIEEWLYLLREQGILDRCHDVVDARTALADFIRLHLRRFEGLLPEMWPTGSLLVGGYAGDGSPQIYSLHSGKGMQPGEFNWIGTPRGGVAADSLAWLLMNGWDERPSLERAKIFGVVSIKVAHLVDPTVGEPVQLAIVTRDGGYRDISNELPMLQERSADAIARLRATFLAEAA